MKKKNQVRLHSFYKRLVFNSYGIKSSKIDKMTVQEKKELLIKKNG